MAKSNFGGLLGKASDAMSYGQQYKAYSIDTQSNGEAAMAYTDWLKKQKSKPVGLLGPNK